MGGDSSNEASKPKANSNAQAKPVSKAVAAPGKLQVNSDLQT
jgi:hypothetical protein